MNIIRLLFVLALCGAQSYQIHAVGTRSQAKKIAQAVTAPAEEVNPSHASSSVVSANDQVAPPTNENAASATSSASTTTADMPQLPSPYLTEQIHSLSSLISQLCTAEDNEALIADLVKFIEKLGSSSDNAHVAQPQTEPTEQSTQNYALIIPGVMQPTVPWPTTSICHADFIDTIKQLWTTRAGYAITGLSVVQGLGIAASSGIEAAIVSGICAMTMCLLIKSMVQHGLSSPLRGIAHDKRLVMNIIRENTVFAGFVVAKALRYVFAALQKSAIVAGKLSAAYAAIVTAGVGTAVVTGVDALRIQHGLLRWDFVCAALVCLYLYEHGVRA